MDVAVFKFEDGALAFQRSGDTYQIEVVYGGHHVCAKAWPHKAASWHWAVDVDGEQVLPEPALPTMPPWSGLDWIPVSVYGWDKAHEMAAERASAGLMKALTKLGLT